MRCICDERSISSNYATGIPTVIDEIGWTEYANGALAIGACTRGTIGVRIWVECGVRVVV